MTMQQVRRRPIVLSVAGSDSGGGAGIQADLKTFAALGVHGTSAITGLTAQNSRGVQRIEEIRPEFVAAQMDSVFDDMEVAAVKTGMLVSARTVEVVAECLTRRDAPNLVVDPVMVAQSGKRLVREDARDVFLERLVPLARLVTPNLPEAEVLTGLVVNGVDSMKEAARRLVEKGACACLVKGGHLEGDAVDVFFDGTEPVILRVGRIASEDTHGTGCTLASAVAAGLALGASLRDAVADAKRFVTQAIRCALRIGAGPGCVDPAGAWWREAERYRLWVVLSDVVERLEKERLGRLVPEVQSQIVMALEGAEATEDVLGFPGRLVRVGERICAVRAPRFGASSHIARVALAVMRHDPGMRAAMNIRYGEDVLEACRGAGLSVASFDRDDEPAALRSKEGQSLPLGVARAIERAGRVPDVIADSGDLGKEPMVRLLGRDPEELEAKLLAIGRAMGLVS